MKTFLKHCLLACITLFNVACTDSVKLTGNEFLIEGKISGVEDRVMIAFNGLNNRIIDTVKNGHFMFRGEAASNPEQRSIQLIENDGIGSFGLHVWIAPGTKIKITGKGRATSLWKVKSSVPSQKEANRYANENRDFRGKIERISLEHRDMMKKVRAASSENEARAYTKAADSIMLMYSSLLTELRIKEIYSDISIMEKTDISTVWLYKMSSLSAYHRSPSFSAEQSEYFHEKVLELYERMSEDDKNTHFGNLATTYLFPRSFSVVGVGDNMADADLLDINGNTKRLADYLGKYILLDFWHSGCGPCIKAFPEIKVISETYRDKLTIISISFDSDSKWKETSTKHDMSWVNLRDPKNLHGLTANYGVKGTPNYIMISPEGKIIDNWYVDGKTSLTSKVVENLGL